MRRNGAGTSAERGADRAMSGTPSSHPPATSRAGAASLDEDVSRLREGVAARHGIAARHVRVVVAPYRICPLGAPIDHQGGPVLGIAIDRRSLLAFAPQPEPEVELRSANFPGVTRFRWEALADAREEIEEGWGVYPLAAARALRERLPDQPAGMLGEVWGALPGSGLSSSASLLLACLRAFAESNGASLGVEESIERVREAENRYVGVQSGFLDPASIAAARPGELLRIDTEALSWESAAPAGAQGDARFLVFWSGCPRNLAATGFNQRVEECHAAARALAGAGAHTDVSRLGALSDTRFETHGGSLPAAQRRRAAHFFGERQRVERGWQLWRRGDLSGFGQLMFESCRSSIENYQTGSPELIALQEILEQSPGVLGARFSGAGFGGCSLALVEAGRADALAGEIHARFAARFPELGEHAWAHLARSVGGVELR